MIINDMANADVLTATHGRDWLQRDFQQIFIKFAGELMPDTYFLLQMGGVGVNT